MVTVADAYDAMNSDRPYRSALDPERVRQELEAGVASQFDPELAKEFLLLVESGACDEDVQATASPWALAESQDRSGGAGRAVDAAEGDAR